MRHLFKFLLFIYPLSLSCSNTVFVTHKDGFTPFINGAKYVISSPIDLGGKKLSLPEGSHLVFKGDGMLANCIIVGNYSRIDNPRFKNVTFGGIYTNKNISITDNSFYGEVDLWGLFQAFPYAEIILEKDIVVKEVKDKDIKVLQMHLDGKGHTIHFYNNPIVRNTDVNLKNITFDCSRVHDRILYAIGSDKNNQFIVTDCIFNHNSLHTCICVRDYYDVRVENCLINGTLKQGGKRAEEYGAQILVYECGGKITINRNKIKNCYGIGIEGLGFVPDSESQVCVEKNTIDSVSNGGIVFTGGEVWNPLIKSNSISNTHCLGNQFEGESESGPNSAINLHGFRSGRIENNFIFDCLKSACFAFNGEKTGDNRVAKGTGLIVSNNRCKRVGAVGLYVIDDVIFSYNQFINSESNSSESFFIVKGSNNVIIQNNSFELYLGTAKRFYPFNLSDGGMIKSGIVLIKDNYIETDGHILVFVNQHYSGECQIDDNTILKSGRKDGTLSVVNNSKAKVSLPKSKQIVRY